MALRVKNDLFLHELYASIRRSNNINFKIITVLFLATWYHLEFYKNTNLNYRKRCSTCGESCKTNKWNKWIIYNSFLEPFYKFQNLSAYFAQFIHLFHIKISVYLLIRFSAGTLIVSPSPSINQSCLTSLTSLYHYYDILLVLVIIIMIYMIYIYEI